MRIDYYGQMKNTRNNTRIACISYNEKEQKEANNIILLMKIQAYNWYKKSSLFENMITIAVEDREEYNELLEWYKEKKKSFSEWKKYGFL